MYRILLVAFVGCCFATACGDSGEDDGARVSDAGAGGGGADGAGGSGGIGIQARLEIVELYPPVDLSSDGAIALLQDFSTVTNDVYLLDTATQVLEKKTETGSSLLPVFGLAGDGSRIIGFHGSPEQAGIWEDAAGWNDLGSLFTTGCDGRSSAGFDLNEDGSVGVGLLWDGCDPVAFRWSDADGEGAMTALERLGVGSNRATVISDDGSVAAGFAMLGPMVDRTPAIWRADGSGFLLDETQEVVGEVLSISEDGRMVAGVWNLDGFYWTEATGVVNIGKFPDASPDEGTFPNAIAAGGKLIFGGSGNAWGRGIHAFVWTEAAGMRRLHDVVAELELDVPEGFHLANVVAASDDGSVILGILTNPDTMTDRTFVLTLPVSVYGI